MKLSKIKLHNYRCFGECEDGEEDAVPPFFVAISRAKKYLMFTYCSWRAQLRVTRQSHKEINEFFDLLPVPEVAKIQKIHEE
jgi:superfamily I DNA/RNA helicase